jgi:drug/metabolite transporter (DMT)-like permease
MAMGVAGGGALSPVGPSAIALLAYMGFISAAAYSVWSLLLSVNSVSRISVYGFMNPVFGFVLSAVLLGEYQQVDPVRSVCALALVSAGIVVVNHVSAKPGSTVGASGSELR